MLDLPAGKLVADRTIERRFLRYGRYAGLAFWLFLTRDRLDDGAGRATAVRLSGGEPAGR